MVVGGGKGTLKTVVEALTNETPLSVVVIVGSGQAAELLAYAYDIEDIDAIYDSNHNTVLRDMVKKLLLDSEEKQIKTYKEVLDCMRKKDYVSK